MYEVVLFIADIAFYSYSRRPYAKGIAYRTSNIVVGLLRDSLPQNPVLGYPGTVLWSFDDIIWEASNEEFLKKLQGLKNSRQ